MSLLEVSNLTVAYDNNIVLQDISFSLEKGEILAIIGPNGSGKSTLLKSILGIKSSSQGTVTIKGLSPNKAVKNFKGTIAYLPQYHFVNLLLPLTVYDIASQVLYAHKKTGKLSQEENQQVFESLSRVKLLDKKDELFMKLSGGQQQRVLLASVIASKPELLFLDEPTSFLDVMSIDCIYQILTELKHDGTGVVIVSHDVSTIVSKADNILVLVKDVKYLGKPEYLSEDMIHHIFGTHIKIIPNDPQCNECKYQMNDV